MKTYQCSALREYWYANTPGPEPSRSNSVNLFMLTLLTILLLIPQQATMIFSANAEENKNWSIVNDGVMGGLSKGYLESTADYMLFKGTVSTANYGGFTSAVLRFDPVSVQPNQKVQLKLKGDGRSFQFRVKADSRESYSYITSFKTNGDWQTITLPLSSFYPSFRGRTLQRPNFNHDLLSEVTILIANKKNEDFELLISEISTVD